MPNQIDMILFSKRLKEARTEKGMTQKELAAASGVSAVMISSYERTDTESGKNPSLSVVYAIAEVLNVSLDWLCGRSEKQSTEALALSTETILRALAVMFSALKKSEDICESSKPDYNYTEELYEITLHENSHIYDFTKEYLNVIPALEYLPEPLQNAVIDKIIDKYAKMTVDELLANGKAAEDSGTQSDMPLADDIPF